MPKQSKVKCEGSIRYSEYYGMQEIFDRLYQQSKESIPLENAMDLILSKDNIVLAYRNIKRNDGSNTRGTDRLTIKDIENLTVDEVVENVRKFLVGSKHGYRPKPVRRKEIPKPNGKTRPLGIPCIWDRLIQQCILQILQPYCEAKFSSNSYGFRPTRSAEHAICKMYNLMNLSHLHYVIELDIEGFFDHVNHSKLIKQMWSMGIRDKKLIYIIKQILKAPIRMPDGKTIIPTEGTPQGGIISPLLANINLNEFDKWIESQWADHPIANAHVHMNGNHLNKGNGYEIMKKTNLKEMRIVRYADDARILCRTRKDTENTLIAVTEWLRERLKLNVSPEKTRIVNVKEQWAEYLGFEIRVELKGGKWVVKSRMCRKAYERALYNLKEQVKLMAKPRDSKNVHDEVVKYNQMVMGIQNYYQIATMINIDCMAMQREIMILMTSRFNGTKQRGNMLSRVGKRKLTEYEAKRYEKSKMLRWLKNEDSPIYPIGYIKHKNPMGYPTNRCPYTPEGRKGIHDNVKFDNMYLLAELRSQCAYDRTIEFMDNRQSLFSVQTGKCGVTGRSFITINEIHCHHITSQENGGNDRYENLILVLDDIHILIHAKSDDTIKRYLTKTKLDKEELIKLNKLREKAHRSPIPKNVLDSIG